jgi:RHS repeat-associated protein
VSDRSYNYDVGNVTAITDNKSAANSQTYAYNHRDRLTSWMLNGATQSYTYNAIGNLLSKTGVGTYTYPASGPSSVRPHTPSAVNGASYSYDANGNLTAGSGRSYTWTAENLPASISWSGGSESYSYDADGERVAKTVGGATTLYFQGVFEQVIGGGWKQYYSFNGAVVAMREAAGAVTYLHNDHLGSASVATSNAGAIAGQQEYDAWGKLRSGGITQTSINYTGQRLDGTGLLYYHARYYDPNLGRFVSADTLVPGADALTIGSGKQSGGPANPQDLNRYSYVINNPINKTDPTGHCGISSFVGTAVSVMSGDCTRRAAAAFRNAKTTEQKVITGAVAAGSALGAAAGWAGGALLAVAGGQAVAGAIAGSSAAASATSAAGTVATTACADGDCGNEVNTVVGATTRGTAILQQAGEVLNQAAARGPELVSGFRIFGNKGLVGNVFNRNILLIEAEQKGAVPLRSLANALETEARAAGASQLRIIGHAVINKGFFNAAIARRLGYTLLRINESTIELTKVLGP